MINKITQKRISFVVAVLFLFSVPVTFGVPTPSSQGNFVNGVIDVSIVTAKKKGKGSSKKSSPKKSSPKKSSSSKSSSSKSSSSKKSSSNKKFSPTGAKVSKKSGASGKTVTINGKKVQVKKVSGDKKTNVHIVTYNGKTYTVLNTGKGSAGAAAKALNCITGACTKTCINVTAYKPEPPPRDTAKKKSASPSGGGGGGGGSGGGGGGSGGGGGGSGGGIPDEFIDNGDGTVTTSDGEIIELDEIGDLDYEDSGVYGEISINGSVKPSLVNVGFQCTLNFTVTNATSCSLVNSAGLGGYVFEDNNGDTFEDSELIDPGTYTLKCSNDDTDALKTFTCNANIDIREQ